MPRTMRRTCNQLLRRSIDLCRLYRRAARRCEPGLALVLRENAQTLDLLIADLQQYVKASGGRARCHGSWRGALRWHVSDMLLQASSDRGAGWVHLLAHHESGLMQLFERLTVDGSTELAQLLRRQLPRMRSIDLDMHMLDGGAGY